MNDYGSSASGVTQRVDAPSENVSPEQDLQTTASAPKFRLYALAALTTACLLVCSLLLFPVLSGVTWGIALTIIMWPIYQRALRSLSPTPAASIVTLVVAVVILVASFFVTYQLASEAGNAAAGVQENGSETPVRDNISKIPAMHSVVAWMDKVGVDIETEARKWLSSFLVGISSLANGSIAAAIQFLIAIFVLFYLLRDHRVFLDKLKAFLPLSDQECTQVFDSAQESVRANLYATIVTSVIDCTIGGFLFWMVGLPAPILWTIVMFILSILPIVGAGLVWVHAAIFLIMTGHVIGGLIILTWGCLTFIVVDNLLYVRLAGDRMKLHEVYALIAFMGGITVFGISGMILGPAIFAMTAALIDVWKDRVQSASQPTPMIRPKATIYTNS